MSADSPLGRHLVPVAGSSGGYGDGGGSTEWVHEEDGVGVIDFADPFVTRQTQRLLQSFQRTFQRPMLPDMPEGLSTSEQARYVEKREASRSHSAARCRCPGNSHPIAI